MSPFPILVPSVSPNGEYRYFLGEPLVDRYLEFVAGRARLTQPEPQFFSGVDRPPHRHAIVTVTMPG